MLKKSERIELEEIVDEELQNAIDNDYDKFVMMSTIEEVASDLCRNSERLEKFNLDETSFELLMSIRHFRKTKYASIVEAFYELVEDVESAIDLSEERTVDKSSLELTLNRIKSSWKVSK